MAEGSGGVKSAGRAIEVIEFVAQAGTAGFSEILEGLGIPRSSGHGLIRTLLASGWLDRDAGGQRYRLGLRAWQVGQSYEGNLALVERAKPVMDDLSAETGETVQLARLDGVENVYIAISLSANPMRMASTVGMRLHAHATGIGKALLSTLDPEEAEHRLSGVVLPRLTERTVTDVPDLLRLTERARMLGYAIDDEEFVAGCRCVAVVLTSEHDTGIASALSITAPTFRTDSRWPQSLVPALQRAVRRIRQDLSLPVD
ncbi:MAG: IclR family transcriptional regulator [Microbacterium sp.]